MAETILTSGDLLPQLIGIPDNKDWRGRKPVTPPWQPGAVPLTRIWAAKGSDFQGQFRVNERGVFVYGEICGRDAYTTGNWSWNDGEGHSGSGSLACYYTFETTTGTGGDPDTHEVVVNNETTGNSYISASPVGIHPTRPDGGIYSVIETRGNGDEYERTVGSITLSGEVTHGVLASYTSEWKGKTADFREATKIGGFTAWKSDTDKGWWATVAEGTIRFTADISEDAGGYTGWTGAYQVGFILERRKNKPTLYDEGELEDSGNGIYRNGSARWILTDEILTDVYRDNYGTYGIDAELPNTWDKTPWVAASGGLITGFLEDTPQYIGRNILNSADGKRYRVTAQAGEGFGEAWDPVTTVTVEVQPGEGTILEFSRAALEADPAGLTRITLIEVWDPVAEEYGTLAVYPQSEAMVGRDVGIPGIRLYAAYQLRFGPKWGHLAFDGTNRRFRHKRLIKVASIT